MLESFFKQYIMEALFIKKTKKTIQIKKERTRKKNNKRKRKQHAQLYSLSPRHRHFSLIAPRKREPSRGRSCACSPLLPYLLWVVISHPPSKLKGIDQCFHSFSLFRSVGETFMELESVIDSPYKTSLRSNGVSNPGYKWRLMQHKHDDTSLESSLSITHRCQRRGGLPGCSLRNSNWAHTSAPVFHERDEHLISRTRAGQGLSRVHSTLEAFVC